MRATILIVGSLLWDCRYGRESWRQARLNIDHAVHVKVPIRYGRQSESRGNTFTMTLSRDGKLGQGVLVPCKANSTDVAAFLAEAEEFWKVEKLDALAKSIGASWGCVGILFRAQSALDDCRRAWADYFPQKACAIPPVDKEGMLQIPWPVVAADGAAADADVLLAIATKAATPPPAPNVVADAWIDQDQGYERYFFENVRYGIRTPEDGLIWRRIEERRPSWLGGDTYAEAVTILRREASA